MSLGVSEVQGVMSVRSAGCSEPGNRAALHARLLAAERGAVQATAAAKEARLLLHGVQAWMGFS